MPESYVAIIPARSGSKGLPGKNILDLCGKPLIAWTIEVARATARVDRVIVSTDSEQIAAVARGFGAETPFLRPPALSDDSASTEGALLHALGEMESTGVRPEAVVLLQPTSPLRHAGAVDRAITQFESSGADSLVSVCESYHFHWRNPGNPEALYDFRRRPRRQEIPLDERLYGENGSIYITLSSVLKADRNRLGGRIVLFEMSQEESWQIDTLADFRAIEALMRGIEEAR